MLLGNNGHDGHFSPVTIGIFLVLGGAIWVVQQAWELISNIVEFLL